MANDPQQIVQFSQPAADKIVAAVKEVLSEPVGAAGSPVRAWKGDNRIFWSNTAQKNLQEVYPQAVLSSGSPTGQLNFTAVPSSLGGRQTVDGLMAGVENGDLDYGMPQLVRQDFDTSTNPPTVICTPLCPICITTLAAGDTSGGGTTGSGVYTGTIGGNALNAKIVTLNEPFGTGGGAFNICSGRYIGWIVGTTSDNPSKSIVYVDAEYKSKVVWVALTIDGGSNGTDPSITTSTSGDTSDDAGAITSVTYTAATAPTYTYTAKTTTGAPFGAGGIVVGTGLTPIRSRKLGVCSPPGNGIGWFNSGTFVLFDAGE